MNDNTAVLDKPVLKPYKHPKTILARFVAKRTYKSASLWALVFGAYMADKTLALAKLAPTQAQLNKVTSTLSNNVGLNALLGTPHHLNTLAGYANWNSLSVITIVASIWAFLLATKYFRGEEDNGRAELMYAGQTTARKGALNILAGLGSSFLIMFLITALLFIEIGKTHTLGWSPGSSFFFALSSVSGAALFLSVGALTSQIMPTRSRASSAAAVVFGVFYLIRAMADVTSLHWLLNVTPLGWIERLQPLVGSQPIWLLPIFGLTAVLCGLTLWLAGKRDLGESIVPDKDSAKAKTRLLNSPFFAALRLTRASSIAWMSASFFMALFYGALTKAAAQSFSQIANFHKVINKLARTSNEGVALLYLAIVFFIMMAVLMAYAASAIGKVREDEADGFVDNFLVRPVSRVRWLGGRVLLITLIGIVGCFISGLGVWAGEAAVKSGIAFHPLMVASANMIAPVLFTLGVGVFTLGIKPRLTTLAAYGVLAWAFMLDLIASGLNLNHWLLDTSVLHQVSLSPAANPNWTTNLVMIAVGAVLSAVGVYVFNKRDLQSE